MTKELGYSKEWCTRIAALEPEDGVPPAGLVASERLERQPLSFNAWRALGGATLMATAWGKGGDPVLNACEAAYIGGMLSAGAVSAPTLHLVDTEYPVKQIGVPNPYDKPMTVTVAPTLGEQHPDDAAVNRFAAAMREKMAASRAKGRRGWSEPDECSAADLTHMLRQHVEKGDPVDVANFCMMLHQRGERIATAIAQPQVAEQKGLTCSLGCTDACKAAAWMREWCPSPAKRRALLTKGE